MPSHEVIDIAAEVRRLDDLIYSLLASDSRSRFIAVEGRLKTLVYFPQDVPDVLLLNLDLQLELGMKYRIQELIEAGDGSWQFEAERISTSLHLIILRLIEANRLYNSQHTAIRRATTSTLDSFGVDGYVQLLAVETRPISLGNGSFHPVKFATHLSCLREMAGEISFDANFWEVGDAEEWRALLCDDILPYQRELAKRSNRS